MRSSQKQEVRQKKKKQKQGKRDFDQGKINGTKKQLQEMPGAIEIVEKLRGGLEKKPKKQT